MGTLETVQRLCTTLDTREGEIRAWEARYAGETPLTFLAPEVREKLGDRLKTLNVGICKLACDVLGERLRLQGFVVDGKPDLDLWERFNVSGMDAGATDVHLNSLALGSAYVTVWADSHGLPTPSAEHPAQVVAALHPLTRQPTAVLKRWAADNRAYAVLYEPTTVTVLQSKANVPTDVTGTQAYSIGAIPSTGWGIVNSVPNPLGVVPVVLFANAPRLTRPYGVSEMEAISDLNDALIKVMTDLMLASESAAMPRRWATGIEVAVDDDGNAYDPWEGTTTTAQTENDTAKFGQFAGSDLQGFKTATEIIVRQISALSGLSPQMLGVHSDSAMSADAIRASEASLTAKAEQRQKSFGKSWEDVARLMVAIRDNRDPATVKVSCMWGDPASRSVAQEADAAVKTYAAGLTSRRAALEALGYAPTAIAQIEADAAREAVQRQLLAGPANE